MKFTSLNSKDISLAVNTASSFLRDCGVERKNALRVELAIEETLLKYRDAIGEDNSFTLNLVKRLGRIRLELHIPGERLDPFESEDEPDSEVLRGILSGMGIAPVWQYRNSGNLIVFTPRRKKRSPIVSLCAAIALALLCGGLCRHLPGDMAASLERGFITPLFETFMGLLTAIAGPMIFLSVAWGIFSIGDTATFGRIGKRMIGRFLLMSLLLTMLAEAVFLPFFSLSGGKGGAFPFSELLQMVLDIVPGNFIEPFTAGNPMQIIFTAVLVGLAMLVLGNKVSTAASFLEQANYIVQLIMEAVSSLVPAFVFGSILKLMLASDFSVFFSAYIVLPVMLLGDAVVMAVYIAVICVRHRISPFLLLKKLIPTFLIGLSTASSAAAFSTNTECCEKDLGIDRKLVNFGIPLGQVIFMPGAAVQFLAAGLCMAELYGVDISPAWLLTALLITVVLAAAAPPVPGGALTCYTMLFVQLGIPSEAIAIIIALNVILEFIGTAVNLFCLQTELVELAGSLDMLDREKLKAQ